MLLNWIYIFVTMILAVALILGTIVVSHKFGDWVKEKTDSVGLATAAVCFISAIPWSLVAALIITYGSTS